MRESKSTRCPHCRAKAVRGRPGAGRTTVYKTLTCLPLPSELLIPTCSRCRALFLPTQPEDQGAASTSYMAELRRSERSWRSSTLRDVRSLRKLERLLGVSGLSVEAAPGPAIRVPELTLLT